MQAFAVHHSTRVLQEQPGDHLRTQNYTSTESAPQTPARFYASLLMDEILNLLAV